MLRPILLSGLVALLLGALGCAEAVPAADSGADEAGTDAVADAPSDGPGDVDDRGEEPDGSDVPDVDLAADTVADAPPADSDLEDGDEEPLLDALYSDGDGVEADVTDADLPGQDPDLVSEPDERIEVFGLDLGEEPDFFSPTCGNRSVEGVEQCDDGNFVNLDGCDSNCRYEHFYRLTRLALQPVTAPAWCETGNRLGRAFGTTTGPFNDAIAAQITANSMLLGLWLVQSNLPPVQPDPDVSVGIVGLTTDPRSPVTAGTRDAWFVVPAIWLFGTGPSYRFSPGRVRDEILRAGPSNVTMPFLGTTLNLRDGRVRARFSPEVSTPNEPPLRIAEELLTPNELRGSDLEVGLCGGVTVASLARVPVPSFFTSGPGACSADCANSREYVACSGGVVNASCNSMLDLLVSGCATRTACSFPLVDAVQPDRGAAGGTPRALVPDPVTGKVTVEEPNDAYSAYFHFTGLRAHITNNLSD